MRTNRCQFCDSTSVVRGRYMGFSYVLFLFLSLGVYFFAMPFLPVTVRCLDCKVEYIAS